MHGMETDVQAKDFRKMLGFLARWWDLGMLGRGADAEGKDLGEYAAI